MTDGMGSTSYAYDQLSRLSSETRTFAGLTGSFQLQYGYNLAGELTGITDAGGASVGYSYDSTGRLSSVTGSGGGASVYASNMQYRAWGALKGVAYGNGTSLALSYNRRGLLTHYGVGGVTRDGQYGPAPHGSDYEYYADGRVKFASDLFTDALIYSGSYKLHDRAYSYDYAGRLAESYSGREANQFRSGVESGVWGGFRQTYAYNAWGEQTTRTGRFWSVEDNDSESYSTQGRNIAWEYDADGRLVSRNEPAPDTLPYDPLRQSYDASGRLIQTTQKTSNRDSVNQNIIYTTQTTRTQSYDGDGLEAKQLTQVGDNPPSTAVIYYLRSSVLGGRVIAEYDSQGSRQRSYVFAGGAVVATQYTGIGLLWKQTNPVTGDEMETDSQGAVTGKETLDPMGVNLGDSDPFEQPTGGSGNEVGPSQEQMNQRYAQLLPPSMGGGGVRVRVDGLEVNPYFAFSLLAGGSVKFANTHWIGTGGGVIREWDGNKDSPAGKVIETYQEHMEPVNDDPWTSGFFGGRSFGSANPQNPAVPMTPDQISTIRNVISDLLTDKCAKFIDQLVSSQTGKPYNSLKQLLTDFDSIASGKGGFFFGGNSNSRGGDPTGGDESGGLTYGNVTVRISMNEYFTIPPTGSSATSYASISFKSMSLAAALSALHEMLHGITGAADRSLSEIINKKLGITVYSAPGVVLPFPTALNNDHLDFSHYWNQALQNACDPNEPWARNPK
jgi:YD repeat-containing protein